MPASDPHFLERVRAASAAEFETKIALKVVTADPATEVFVIDTQFQVVARGLEVLDTSVVPGIYKIKVKAGGQLHEELVVLAPGDGARRVDIGPLEIPSAAPLQSGGRRELSRQASALQGSRARHAELGSGSALFFNVRDWERGQSAGARAPRFLLCDAAGNELLDLAQHSVAEGEQTGEGRGCALCNVAVAPGLYRLRQHGWQEVVEMTLIASPGWQTQLFAACRRDEDGETPEIHLADCSVFMKREGEGFHANDREQRLIELARQGLATGRMVLPEQTVMEILDAKFENPMLGIYGAHLLLARKGITTPLAIAIGNLRRLVVDPHPDVESLALTLEDRGSNYRFEVPPMLRRSWSLVIDATLRYPGLIPRESPAGKIGARVLASEPWLLTGQRGDESAEKANADADEALEETVKGFLQEITLPRHTRRRDLVRSLPRAVRSLAQEVLKAAAGGEDLTAPAWWQAKLSESVMARMVNDLGVPREKLQEVLERLTRLHEHIAPAEFSASAEPSAGSQAGP